MGCSCYFVQGMINNGQITKQKTDNTKITIVNIMIYFKILVTACLLLLLWEN